MKKIWLLFFVLLAIILAFPIPVLAQDKEKQQEKQIVYIMSLQGDIFEGLAQRLKKKLKRVDPKKAKVVILEIDTPGGGVGYVMELCSDIEHLTQLGVSVYAYVTGKAWSGGALVSLTCDRIYMRKDTSIGSAQVKILTPLGAKDADEKTLSAMRATFRSRAQARDYPATLAEAMVDPALEVREIVYRGERFFKTPDEILQLRNQPDFKPEDFKEWKIVDKPGELANFTAIEAKDYGFCKEIYQTREELLKGLGLNQYTIKEINVTSEDMVANFLSNQWLRFIFLALGILGLVIEFMTPGFGFPGILGLTFLALFFVGGYLGDVTAVWEIVLFIVGFALLAMEVFVIPGFGVVGIAGLLCCFMSLLLSFQSFVIPSSKEESDLFMFNIFIILCGIGLDIFLVIIISKFLPESAPLQRLSVAAVQKAEDGYTVAIPALAKLQGQQGVAVSPLRPAGRANIGGELHDVVTLGDFINSGEQIQVIEIQGNRVIVDKVRTV